MMILKRVGFGSIALGLVCLACSGSDGQAAADFASADADGRAATTPGGTPATGSGASAPVVAGPTAASPDGAAAAPPPSSDEGGGDTGGSGIAEPGVLTAGTWDDNRNFDFFTNYRKRLAQTPGLLPFAESDFSAALAAFAEPTPRKQTLDIAFVIDTTGSMGDEIRYLQAEFITLSDAIAETYPNAEQRWALVVYRDTGDDYVEQSFDFFEERADFQVTLAEQGADGGGDFPEAPEAGLAAAAALSWRDDAATARLAFWVADAPHHATNAAALVRSVRALLDQQVHVYPVASSGVDELTELSMRSVAQLSGGRYLFLTDDSGVGGAHKEPTLPCYFVTKLDDAILRMVDIELSGEYREPSADEVVRTGGNPENGRCELESGETVQVY
jgi:hypothetical protein